MSLATALKGAVAAARARPPIVKAWPTVWSRLLRRRRCRLCLAVVVVSLVRAIPRARALQPSLWTGSMIGPNGRGCASCARTFATRFQRLGPNAGGGAERGTYGCRSGGVVAVRPIGGNGLGAAGFLVWRFR